jgi:transposase-like protein
LPVVFKGQTYYRTAEVCRTVGINRTTLFRWLREERFPEAACRDRRGWRLFTGEEIDRLRTEASRMGKAGQ